MKYLLALIMIFSMFMQIDSRDIARYSADAVMQVVKNYSPECKSANCG
jgi:hypothetical protein